MAKDTVKSVGDQLQELNRGIGNLLAHLENDNANIVVEDREDPEEMFLKDEYRRVVYLLEDVHSILESLKKPVSAEGHLYRNENGRFEINNSVEFTSGSSIEFLKWDDFDDVEKWVAARIEHTDGDYYLYGHKEVSLEGLHVRTRR